ncbi:MAG: hypothetical protein HY698_17120 [Deltaproteobacteria bacterium]|nr:hypothetical protein [Deltaproteobacteria bacterium]
MLAVLLTVIEPALAYAQFVRKEETQEKGTREQEKETELRGRLSTTAVYYGEWAGSRDGESGEAAATEGPASPEQLLFTDLRARIEALSVNGGPLRGTVDFRLRPALRGVASRGYLGGREEDLREAHVGLSGARSSLTVGRLIVPEVDSLSVDGLRASFQRGGSWEGGVLVGAYPSPLSRSVRTDYPKGRGLLDLPLAGGAWVAYRSGRTHGTVGGAALLPRDERALGPDDGEPARGMITSSGHVRISRGVDAFHYLVGDVAGDAAGELVHLQLGLQLRPLEQLLLEGGISRVSTRQLRIYVADLLETADPSVPPGAPPQANLALVRVGTEEARAGASYLFLRSKVDVGAHVRVRRREALGSDVLPTTTPALGPDQLLDMSLGIRRRHWLRGWSLGGNVVDIRGGRSRHSQLALKGFREFLDERLELELTVSYVDFADRCGDDGPTCTGTLSGRVLRGGATVAFRAGGHWSCLGDLQLGIQSSSGAPGKEPWIMASGLLLRVQYSY